MTARIHADYYGRDCATVYFTPPWWKFWARPTEREARRVPLHQGGMRWHWLDGSEVPDAVWCVLVDAYRASIAQLAHEAATGRKH